MSEDIRSTDPLDGADREALIRYRDGDADPAEVTRVEGWLAEDPRRAAELERLDVAVPSAPVRAEEPGDEEVEGSLRTVVGRVEAEAAAGDGSATGGDVLPPAAAAPATSPAEVVPMEARGSVPNRRRGGWSSAGARAAAAVVLLLGAYLLFRSVASPGSGGEIATAVHVTAVGELREVTLDDGTIVVLGPASRVELAADYGDSWRTVTLTGEAMFEVVHDDARPFLVRSGDAVIRDLGTRFTVRSGADEVRVVVTEGSVVLRAAEETDASGVTLRAGDRGVLAAGSGPTADVGGARPADLAWTRGELAFDDEPMTEVAAELRRWFGIEVRFDDPGFADRHLTASFSAEPVERVVEMIGIALGADAYLDGDTAVISVAVPPPAP